MPARPSERGQILVIFALAFVVLIMLVGIVIDGGYGWAKRREAQNAADFAALAGARVVLLAQSEPGLTNADVANAIVQAADANHGVSISFGADGPQYTDAAGNPISQVYPPDDNAHTQIPASAFGIQVNGASVSWEPFFAGLIGQQTWTTNAQATARFTPGQAAPPCSLCVLGGLSGSASGDIHTEGSILIGGSGGASSSVDITSENGSIVMSDSSGSSSSANISAPNGSIWIDGDYKGSSSTDISAPNGSVYITGAVDFSSSGNIEAGASVLIGEGLSMGSSANIEGASIGVHGNLSMTSSARITVDGAATFGGNTTMSTSARITAGGTVAFGGNLNMSSSSSVSGASVGYVGSHSCNSSCSVTPSPTHIGSVTVPSIPPVPVVEDPYASLFPDATATKVQEAYPAYPSSLTTVTRTVSASSTGTITPTATQIVKATVSSSATATLNPGIYQYIHCGSSARCTLNPGTYYLDGNASALDLSSSSRFTSAGPVTLVFLNSSGVRMSSSTRVQIEAPDPTLTPSTQYPWPGVAMFFARGNTSTLQFSSSSSDSVTGFIYAPAATLEMTSSTNQTITSTVVVGHYKGSSSSKLTISSFGDGIDSAPGPLQLVQ